MADGPEGGVRDGEGEDVVRIGGGRGQETACSRRQVCWSGGGESGQRLSEVCEALQALDFHGGTRLR